MKLFAISDLHLSTVCQKPMDIFGKAWENYFDIIRQDWQEKVTEDDIVLLPGDFSWAMRMDEALADFERVADLPGTKVGFAPTATIWRTTTKRFI